MRVSGGDMHRKTDRFDSSSNQPQSFGDFPHGRLHRPNTKLTCLLLLLLQEQGDFLLASTPTGDEEPHDMRETLRSLAKMEEAQVVPFLSTPPTTSTHRRNRKDRRQAYSLFL